MPLFLVSHIRGDDDAYVEEFFHDLCREVRALTGTGRTDDVGTLATDLDPAEGDWPPATARALASCQVFLPLCSPRLLLSESGGRHWWLFHERLRRFSEDNQRDAASLLPLRWVSMPDLPPSFPEFLAADPTDPRRPLRQYLRLRTLRPHYRSFLHRLAGQIVKTARSCPLPPYWPLPSAARTPNAFAPSETGLDRPLVPGTRNVRFVVAAGSRGDMERVRAAVEYYGKDSTEWAPYRPLRRQPLVEQAQAIAAGQLFDSHVTGLEDLRRTLDVAKEANDLVVLLLDPWSTRLPASRRQLSEADLAGLPDAAVLVPVSDADPESEQSRDELMFDVEQTLARFLGRYDALYSGRLPTPESFGNQLASTLEQSRNRRFRVGRPAPGSASAAGDRPILNGP
ncbi:hypothetical protein GCM10020358_52840 [Amorphoplanes nipponensis]|uniref:FxsC C-terminal domain-containing protein n=1 Tax=Actinoplanes nipponensis TaxID=135950 RepID=A0A919JI16_9ACTN|nr:hypothetical protein Ani05nite_31100 [Actinoplanes nipponensis]